MNTPMTIAVASGKGGTGKTTVATSLAAFLARRGRRTQYVDCDVEEPNGHIFLKPDIADSHPVTVPVPQVDTDKCDGCGRCGRFCRFNAIVAVNRTVITFEQLCHSCGGCVRVCPHGAIRERPVEIGRIESGTADGLQFIQGRLNIGSVRTPSLIRTLRQSLDAASVAILDAPPGTSCPVVACVRGVDCVLLVTEPTPFGLHDLKLAAAMVQQLRRPLAVIVNRSGLGDQRTHAWCREHGVEILAEIPDDRRIAEAYSRGRMLIDAVPEYEALFAQIAERLFA